MEAFKAILPTEIRNSMKLFEFLAHNNKYTSFPNVVIALRVYMTIQVTVASRKRSCSKLKVIKTYLRSSVQQERLNIVWRFCPLKPKLAEA